MNAAITDMQMRHAYAPERKIHEGVRPHAKVVDALRDDVAAECRRLHYQSSLSVSACEATTASGVDNAASPTGRHR